MMRLSGKVMVTSFVFAVGCSSSGDPEAPAGASGGLALAPVAWNPANADVGSVAAIVEQDKTLAIFGSKGVLTFTSGAIASSDATITDWRSAAVIPSPDGISTWLCGIDGAGHVMRVSTDQPPESVGERYGLASDKVKAVASAANLVAFLLEDGLAVSDGAKVTHYKVATPRALAMSKSNGLFALADGAGVRIFDHGKETDVALPDAQLVAYDGGGHLLAATSHALYAVEGGTATLVHDAGTRTIRQLDGAASAVWLTIDASLARWQNGQMGISTGATVAPDARLVASASGDVWVMSNGQLQRWSVAAGAAGAGGDEATWNASVQPVYAAVCSNCHSPPGSGKSSSNIDLSTYEAWSARRPRVYERVVTSAGKSTAMPPPSSAFQLTNEQREAIAAWSKP